MLRRLSQFAPMLLLLTIAAAEKIPTGTTLTVRVTSAISSGTAEEGQSFDATLARKLVVGGKTLAKAGAPAHGKIVIAKSSGRLHAPGELSLRLTSVQIHGRMTSVSTHLYSIKGKSHTKGNAEKIGGGAALGALIGGIAGGGKGAAIGAVAGGGAGTGVAAATGREEAVVPTEAAIAFTTTRAVTVK
jgi:hypothetical protein